MVAIFSLMVVMGQDADPISISNNSVGDIVTVNVKANAVVSSQIEQNILSVILGILNQQAAAVATGQEN